MGMTYFYNGEKLLDRETEEYLIYNEEERLKWQVIVVLPGVEVIPEQTFWRCYNVETVIMSDSVKKIEDEAFRYCECLVFVRLSTNLEYIGEYAFHCCESLTSIFIPETCREIGWRAFYDCEKLIILNVPRNTRLGRGVIECTALIEASHFETDEYGYYNIAVSNDRVNEWIKDLNQAPEFTLHRECAFIEPSEDNIYEIIKQQGLPSIHVKNQIGVTSFDYLQNNPYAENHIDQHKLMMRLVLDLMGEIIA